MDVHFYVHMSKIRRMCVRDIRQLLIPVHHVSENRPFQMWRNVQLKSWTVQSGYRNINKYSFS